MLRFDAVGVEFVVVQQRAYQGQQVVGRLPDIFHVRERPPVADPAKQQVGVAQHGRSRRLEVVSDGQHQPLAHPEQVFGAGVGLLERLAITAGVAQVTPDEEQEKASQHEGTPRRPGQREGSLPAQRPRRHQPGGSQALLFGIEILQQLVRAMADVPALTAHPRHSLL